jgi:hypothetical protein
MVLGQEGEKMKIKRCPNPACKITPKDVHITGTSSFWVVCHNCFMEGPMKCDKEAAISAWNNLPRKRTSQEKSQKQERKKVRNILKELMRGIKSDGIEPKSFSACIEREVNPHELENGILAAGFTGERQITITYRPLKQETDD